MFTRHMVPVCWIFWRIHVKHGKLIYPTRFSHNQQLKLMSCERSSTATTNGTGKTLYSIVFGGGWLISRWLKFCYKRRRKSYFFIAIFQIFWLLSRSYERTLFKPSTLLLTRNHPSSQVRPWQAGARYL